MSRLIAFASMALAWPALAHAQQRITGKVSSSTGQPVPSASVIVVGTTVGTVTGDDGRFALNVPTGASALTIRRIGYKRVDLKLTPGQTEVTAVMERDVLELDRLVVTGVATTVASANAANDIPQISSEALRQVSSPTIESALQGRAAGLQVTANSGAPGGGNQIRIRGVSSVFGSADPLYVIDGILVSNVTVQSGINALTGASSASANASAQDNGVNRIADLNPYDIESVEILKGASASAVYGARGTNGVVLITTRQGRSGASHINVTQRLGTSDLSNTLGLRHFTLDEAIAQGKGVGLSETDVRANYAACNGFCDYERQLYGERPMSHETAVTASGGSDATKYFASGVDHYDGGIEANTGYRKQSARLNLDQLFGSRATLSFNSNLTRTVARRAISNNDNANATPYFVIGATPTWFDMRPKDGVYPKDPFVPGGSNIFQTRDLVQSPEEGLRLITGAAIGYAAITTPRNTLNFRIDGGYDRLNQTDNLVARSDLYWESADGLPGTVTYQAAVNQLITLNTTAVHTYTPQSDAFKATTSAGMQRTLTDFQTANTVSRNVPFGLTTAGSGTSNQVFGTHTLIKDFAFFATEDLLLWNERLGLNGAARAEKSTVDGDVDKYYVYPKGSASLRVGSVGSYLGDIKLRSAFGKAGNQPNFGDRYSPAGAFAYTGQNAFRVGAVLGKTNIRPEVTTELEGGVDATLFGSFGSIALTGYQRTTKDVILRIATAPSLGFTTDIRNGGQFRNRGFEASLQLNLLSGRTVDWLSKTTFSKNVGIVQALPADIPAAGFALPNAFGAGYGQGQLQVGKSITQIIFAGTNGVNVTVGDQAPDYMMGFSNDFTVHGLRLSSLFDWQKGGDLVNITQNVFDAGALASDVADGGAARAADADHPVYVQHAGFVKLREVSLSYPLPASWTRMAFRGLQSARLEVSGRNLKTWTKYKGLDPEVSNFGNQAAFRGIDLAPFPPSRSYFAGVQVSF